MTRFGCQKSSGRVNSPAPQEVALAILLRASYNYVHKRKITIPGAFNAITDRNSKTYANTARFDAHYPHC